MSEDIASWLRLVKVYNGEYEGDETGTIADFYASLHHVISDLKHQAQMQAPQPKAFVIAWHGVLSLAGEGFTSSLWNIKDKLNGITRIFPENSGSKWPKCTLGALRNGKTLSKNEYSILQGISERATKELLAHWSPETMNRLSLVLFTKRSLQEDSHLSRVDITLKSSGVIQSEPVVLSSAEYVQRVLDECKEDAYYDKVALPGFREDRYLVDMDKPEATLVYFFSQQNKHIFQQFQQWVDDALPDCYSWMPLDALHMTLRGIKIDDLRNKK